MANHTTGAQRYNNRMDKIMSNARDIESKRLSQGHAPNPSLTSSEVAKKHGWERKGNWGEFTKAKSKALKSKIK